MNDTAIVGFEFFSDPLRFYNAMLEDINNAKECICLELYRLGNDPMGQKFRDALTKKSREGLKIRLLFDSWGTSLNESFFDEMIKNGAEVRFFQKIKIAFDFFTKNHKRNHRKLLLIDDKISYIGSANITGYSMNWRESVLRIEGSITKIFKRTFEDSFEVYNKYLFNKFSFKKIIRYDGYKIVRDTPSIYRQQIESKDLELIKYAEKEVSIETPYFLPGFMLRKTLMDAGSRGVKVTVIIPRHSDVMMIDILRSKYLGILHKNNVKIQYYLPKNLHAKTMLIDNKVFSIGSPNFDYRSFRYQYEMILIGEHPGIVKALRSHIDETLVDCEPFDYTKWKNRPGIQKVFEQLLVPFRHLL